MNIYYHIFCIIMLYNNIYFWDVCLDSVHQMGIERLERY